MKSGKVILGLLAGLAAGAIIGVLLAPDKGSETRKKVFKKGEDFADNLKQKFNEIMDDLAQKTNSSGQPNSETASKEPSSNETD